MVISQNMVIVNFLFILVTFHAGIMASFLTSIHWCPEAHWSVRTKQRENSWIAIHTRHIFARADLTKFINDCVPGNGCRIDTTEPNRMILVSFFSGDNVLSDEIKICYIFEFQSNENRAFRFWDTRYISFINFDEVDSIVCCCKQVISSFDAECSCVFVLNNSTLRFHILMLLITV